MSDIKPPLDRVPVPLEEQIRRLRATAEDAWKRARRAQSVADRLKGRELALREENYRMHQQLQECAIATGCKPCRAAFERINGQPYGEPFGTTGKVPK